MAVSVLNSLSGDIRKFEPMIAERLRAVAALRGNSSY
jgi:hypothetical protein